MSDVRNISKNSGFKEAVCIDVGRVYDSCCDRDCMEGIRLYFKGCDQGVINNAVNVKIRSAEVVNALVDVEPVHLNRGFFACDITIFFLVKVDVFTAPHTAPVCISGIGSADKKVILFGSEGNVKVFSNETTDIDSFDPRSAATSNLPRCVVSCVDPVPLAAKLCRKGRSKYCRQIPECVCRAVGGEVNTETSDDDRSVEVTLGIFTIVQLIRNVQMLVPVYDFCVPEKECKNSTDNPCDIFSKIQFPLDDFFPPKSGNTYSSSCGCGERSDDDYDCECEE